ncbi:hypothetical protein ACFSO0_01820 [Brevibacillus sp. GCM10020057]|uniref:hypothetical protein n=1 Tax=Brevibacillus sp. GCM10020057 TaxID=3317327 RepID=UPI0036344017
MKKRWWVLGASAGVAAVLLWGAGMPVRADDSGLGVYKAAMKQTKEEASLTAHAKVDVTDNGKQLYVLSAEAKVDHDKGEASVSGTVEDVVRAASQSFQVFREDGKVVVKRGDSDLYRVIEQKGWNPGPFAHRTEPPVIVEHVKNIALGDIREQAKVEALPDGGKQVKLELSGQQLPLFADRAAGMFFSKLAEHSQAAATDQGFSLKLPVLKENIHVEKLALQADIDGSNHIRHQTAQLHVAGQDEGGQQHELVVKLDVELSDFSRTEVAHLDLTGKQVERTDGWQRPSWK